MSFRVMTWINIAHPTYPARGDIELISQDFVPVSGMVKAVKHNPSPDAGHFLKSWGTPTFRRHSMENRFISSIHPEWPLRPF
jgi:hypothetical protein